MQYPIYPEEMFLHDWIKFQKVCIEHKALEVVKQN